jgi:hypothetical protein
MTDEQRRVLDAFIRINQFGIDEGASFPPIGVTTFAELGVIIDNVQASGTEQMSAVGDSGEQFELKGIKREVLRNYVSVTSRTAKSMRYAFPGIEEQFKMPRNRTDADILASGRAFVVNGNPIKSDFEAYGLSGSWFGDMSTAADEFEATFGPAAAAQADRAEATAEIQDWVVQGMRLRRILDGIAKNIFANNPGKLAAWLQASHIERPPKSKTPPAPPVPPEPPTP